MAVLTIDNAFCGLDYDITGWVYANVNKDISAQISTGVCMYIKDDGSTLYALNQADDTIYQYSFGTAWDITTLSYASKSFDLSAKVVYTNSFYIDPSGTRLYAIDFFQLGSNKIFQYSLGTAWDISSASFVGELYLGGVATSNYAFWFSPEDGEYLYIFESQFDRIRKWRLSTPWDITTGTYQNVYAASENATVFITPSPDGAYMYQCRNNDILRMHVLGTDWDLTTGTIETTINTNPYPQYTYGMKMHPLGSQMFILGLDGIIYKWIKDSI